ncbi:hypothetical protein FN846DRAFT_404571 [Sphaerosporella brunnea]|uniref:Secreted protein n=1 Tax=Sphaerosporella brunnea TaxID=1250544 RepID=A0A5J5F5G3_9PEZI|nr:hypothetical protein FN846DRAFT_404571 [Sphaerosporella brunnea]
MMRMMMVMMVVMSQNTGHAGANVALVRPKCGFWLSKRSTSMLVALVNSLLLQQKSWIRKDAGFSRPGYVTGSVLLEIHIHTYAARYIFISKLAEMLAGLSPIIEVVVTFSRH